MTSDRWTDLERKEELDDAVAVKVQYGARVEFHSDFQAVLITGRRPNHLMHFALGLITFGLWWLFVWIPVTIQDKPQRITLSVDEQGNIHERPAFAARPPDVIGVD